MNGLFNIFIKTCFLLMTLCYVTFPAHSTPIQGQPKILGTWLFYKYTYQGHDYLPPDPNLKQTFEFFEDGTNRLYYYQEIDKTFCERKANYSWDGKTLYQKVTWVNPKNHSACSQDSDMRMSAESFTSATVDKGELLLELPLNEDIVIIHWKKQPDLLGHPATIHDERMTCYK